MMMLALYYMYTYMLISVFIVQADRNNSPQVDMLPHSNTLS